MRHGNFGGSGRDVIICGLYLQIAECFLLQASTPSESFISGNFEYFPIIKQFTSANPSLARFKFSRSLLDLSSLSYHMPFVLERVNIQVSRITSSCSVNFPYEMISAYSIYRLNLNMFIFIF